MKYDGYTIVTDMDGTLLNSNSELSTANIDAIKYFVENGGNFTVATGRMQYSAGRFVEKLGLNMPAILYNGIKIYDYRTEELIFETFLEEFRKNIIRKIADDNPELGVEIYCEETVYIYQACKYSGRFSNLGYEVVYDVDESIFNKKWTKVLVIGDKELIDELEASYKEKYEEGETIRSGELFFEIVPNETSKGIALDLLCDRLDIDRNKLITIGDNMNDLDLIKRGIRGYCVENGSDRVKKQIEHIAVSNDEDIIPFLLSEIEKIFNIEEKYKW